MAAESHDRIPGADHVHDLGASVNSLLTEASNAKASDMHLRVGLPPMMRVHGDVRPIPNKPPLTTAMVEGLMGSLLSAEMKREFYENKACDFSHAVQGLARFRVAFFLQQGLMGGVFREIPQDIPTLADLAAPAALLDFARRPRGLVLVTGPTGSGKSTTLAAVLDAINSERSEHILTVEDPIEFVHTPKRCIVNQREIGRDCPSFARGLRDALRQDPDVILVGEMRDLETVQTAMTAAETGHLVFGTLHTSSAPSTIDRIIDQYPEGAQQQIRVMLANSLIGVVTQALLPKADGSGRVAAHEILVVNNPVRAHIRNQQVAQIRSTMQTQARAGMQTMDRALVYLVSQGIIAEDIGRGRSQNQEEFEQLLKGVKAGKPILPPNLVQQGQVGQAMPGETTAPVAAPTSQSPPDTAPAQSAAPPAPAPASPAPAPASPAPAPPGGFSMGGAPAAPAPDQPPEPAQDPDTEPKPPSF